MANQTNTNYNSFEANPGGASTGINLSHAKREYQSSIVIEQDPKKEGILSFFENINYNAISVAESTPAPTSQPSVTVGNQSQGMY